MSKRNGSSKRNTKSRAEAIDKHVSARIREIREGKNLKRTDMAEVLGVSYQQVQKYENGTSTLSSAKLFKISRFLEVNVSDLFAGMPSTGDLARWASEEIPRFDEMLRKPENMRLVETFNNIEDLALRRKLFSLIDQLARAA